MSYLLASIFSLFQMQNVDLPQEALSSLESFYEQVSPKSLQITKLPRFTNRVYLLNDTVNCYVFRIPGIGTSTFIPRGSEYQNSLEAYRFQFTPAQVLFFDPKTGIQISSYIEDFVTLKFEELYQKEMIQKIARLLKGIHSSEMGFENKIRLLHRSKILQDVIPQEIFSDIKGYFDVKDALQEIEICLDSSVFQWVPCHGDPVPSNFLSIAGKMMLFDWEYSGLCDPALDLAHLSCIMGYSSEVDQWMLTCYGRGRLLEEKMHIFKPLVEFWLATWGIFQITLQKSPSQNNFFHQYAVSRIRKCQKYMASSEFQDSLKKIKNEK